MGFTLLGRHARALVEAEPSVCPAIPQQLGCGRVRPVSSLGARTHVQKRFSTNPSALQTNGWRVRPVCGLADNGRGPPRPPQASGTGHGPQWWPRLATRSQF
jgi:hypothetical protein